MIEIARQEGIDTDFIVLTGHGDKKDAIAAVRLHVEWWVEKHEVELDKLLEKVQEFAAGMPLDKISRILSVLPDNAVRDTYGRD